MGYHLADAIELLFGVKGGSAITPGTSGEQIKADIDSIVQQLHTGGDLELKFTANQASLTALRDELKKAASGIEVTLVKGADAGGGSPDPGKNNTDDELKRIRDLISGTKELYRLKRDGAKFKNANAAQAYSDAAATLEADLQRQAAAANLTAKQIKTLQDVQRRGETELAAEKLRAQKAANDAQAAETKRTKASISQIAELRSQWRNWQSELKTAKAAGIVESPDLADMEDAARRALTVVRKDKNGVEQQRFELAGLINETDLAKVHIEDLNRIELGAAIGTIKAVRSNVKSLTDEHNGQEMAVAAVTNSYAKLANRVQDYMTRIQPSLQRDPGLQQKLQTMVDQIRLGTSGEYKTVLQASAAFQQLQGEIKGAGLETENLWQSVNRIVKQKFGYGVLASAALMARRQLVQVYQNVAELDAKLTELQIVSGETGDTMARYMDKAAVSAKRVSAAITDIIDATTVYRRLGFSMSNSLDFAELTTMYSKVGGVDIGEAESNITAIIKAFNLENAEKLRAAMDKIVTIGNNFAISSAEIGLGLNNAASALVAANNSFDESLAVLTAAQAITQDASKSSTAIRTIAARLTQSSTELGELGEEIDEAYNTTAKYREKLLTITGVDILQENGEDFKSTFQILRELAGAWEGLSNMDQASVTYMVAGIRNSNVFNSLMQQWKDAEGVVEATSNASGAMSEAYEVYTDSIEGRLNVLKASAQELSGDLLSDDAVKGAVTGVTALVNILDKLISTIGTVPVAAGGLGIAGLIRSVGGAKMIALQSAPTYAPAVTRNEYAA